MLIFLPIILFYYAQDFAYYSSMPAYYSTIMLVKINDIADESSKKCSFQSMFLLELSLRKRIGQDREEKCAQQVTAEATASGFYRCFFAIKISSQFQKTICTLV